MAICPGGSYVLCKASLGDAQAISQTSLGDGPAQKGQYLTVLWQLPATDGGGTNVYLDICPYLDKRLPGHLS